MTINTFSINEFNPFDDSVHDSADDASYGESYYSDDDLYHDLVHDEPDHEPDHEEIEEENNQNNNSNDELSVSFEQYDESDDEKDENNIKNMNQKYTIYVCENKDFVNKSSKDISDNDLENYLCSTSLIKSIDNQVTYQLNKDENVFGIKIYKGDQKDTTMEEYSQLIYFCGPENLSFVNKNKIIWMRNKNNFNILVEYNKCRILGLDTDDVVGFYFDDDIVNSMIIKINTMEKYINFGKLNLIENIN